LVSEAEMPSESEIILRSELFSAKLEAEPSEAVKITV
jgi:hypothetical protein